MQRAAFRLIAALALAACTTSEEPRIDMTTVETAKDSMAAIRDSLPEAERARFSDATTVLLLHALGPDRAAAAKNPEKSEAAVKAALDGKTAAQVIAEADAIRAQTGTEAP